MAVDDESNSEKDVKEDQEGADNGEDTRRSLRWGRERCAVSTSTPGSAHTENILARQRPSSGDGDSEW
jgi:hypothetical protein